MSIICGRSRIATQFGIVAASQPLAAKAGVQILERGGTAVDAAIAANAVMGVVEPEMNGIGGDLFAIVYEAGTRALHGINAGGWAPAALTAAFLRARGHSEMPFDGIHSVTVPGCVAGWTALHKQFGALPLQHVLAPAIFYAERGFPVSDIIAERWARWVDKLRADPNAAATLLVDGRSPRAGEVFVNAALGRSLRIVAKDGARGFYEGAIAHAILDAVAAHGGTMTAGDLAEYSPEWATPICRTYRGWEVFELPPNTQGIAALMMLGIMERFPLRDYGVHSPRAMHVMIEAKKLAYADMLRYVGDQRFCATPVSEMLSGEYAASRAALIREDAAMRKVEPSELAGLTTAPGGDTIYLSAIDRHGNIVSLIQSIYGGFGSGIAPAGGGFMLHNRGALFTLEEGHPNALAARKRPLHTIIPGFMRKADASIGFGIMGAWNQAQAHAQFVANIVDFDLDIQEALEAGRFTKPTFTGADVCIEALVPESTRTVLAKLGHDITVVPPRTGTFGSGQAVMSDGSGVHYGASEPRHDGAAIPEAAPAFR